EIVTRTACSCGKHTKRQRAKFHCRRTRSLSHAPTIARVVQNNVIMRWFARTQWGFCTVAGERWTPEHCAISVTAAKRLGHHRSRRWLNKQLAMARADHTQSHRPLRCTAHRTKEIVGTRITTSGSGESWYYDRQRLDCGRKADPSGHKRRPIKTAATERVKSK